jgi:hypothetical protein
MTDRDERVLEELRQLVREVDPVPDNVTSFARAALGWRRMDAELAELLADSAFESEALAGTRGVARARVVTFRAPDLELDVEIRPGDVEPGLVLMGQLAPGAPAAVEVQRDDGSTAASVDADRLGRFRLELAEGGRIRLLVRREDPAPPVETSWLDI